MKCWSLPLSSVCVVVLVRQRASVQHTDAVSLWFCESTLCVFLSLPSPTLDPRTMSPAQQSPSPAREQAVRTTLARTLSIMRPAPMSSAPSTASHFVFALSKGSADALGASIGVGVGGGGCGRGDGGGPWMVSGTSIEGTSPTVYRGRP